MSKLQPIPSVGLKARAALGIWPAPVVRALFMGLAAMTLALMLGGWLLYQQRVQSEIESIKATQQAALESLALQMQQQLISQVDRQRRIAALAGSLFDSVASSAVPNATVQQETLQAWLRRLKRAQALPYVEKIVWRLGRTGPMTVPLSTQDALVEPGDSETVSLLLRLTDSKDSALGTAHAEPPTWSEVRGQIRWQLILPVGAGSDLASGAMLFDFDLGAMLDDVTAKQQPFAHVLLSQSAHVVWADALQAWTRGANLSELAPQAWQAIRQEGSSAHVDAQWNWISRRIRIELPGGATLPVDLQLVSMLPLSDMPTQEVRDELQERTAMEALWAWLVLAGLAVLVSWYRVRRQGLGAVEAERLSGLVNAVWHGVILRTLDGHVVQANEAGRALMDEGFLHALDQSPRMAGGPPDGLFELNWVCEHGQSRVHKLGISAYRWGWRACQLIVAESQTELLQASAQKDAAQRTLAELSMFASFRGDCTLVDVDERLCKVLGRSRGELMGTDYRSLLFMEVVSSESFDACWARLIKGETVHRYLRLRSQQDVMYDLDAVYVPEFGTDGHLKRVLFSARDVSDLSAAKSAGQKSQQLLEAVLQVSESAFLVLDGQYRVVTASDRAGRLLGRAEVELPGSSLVELLEPSGHTQVQQILQAVGDEAPVNLELMVVFADGHKCRLDANVLCRFIDGQKYLVLELAERRQAMLVRERQDALKRLFDDSAMVLELDAQGHFVGANANWLQRFSPIRPPEKAQVLWEFCPPQAITGMADRQVIHADMELLDAAARSVWVRGFALSVPDLERAQRNLMVLAIDITEQSLAQRHGTEIEQRAGMLQDLSLDGFLFVATDGRIHDASPAMCHMLRYTHHELCGLKLSEIDKGSHLSPAMSQLAASAQYSVSKQFESVMRKSDMTLIPVHLRIASVQSTFGSQFVIAVKDLSELHQQRRALSGLRTALNATHMVLELDDMGNFVTANQSFLKCFGRIEAECFGRPFRGFDKETVANRTKAFGGSSAPNIGSWEAEHRRFDKTSVWLRSTAIPITEATQQRGGVMILSTDITAAVLARQALEQERALTQIYMQSMPVGIFVHDAYGQFTEVNNAFCQLVAMSREELINMSMFDVEVGLSVEGLTEIWASLEGERSQVGYEGVASQPGGHRVPWRVSLVATEVGGERRLLGGVQDLTKARETESTLQRQAHALDLSHMVVRLDVDWKIFDANQKFLERFDTSLAELIGLDWDEFGRIRPDDNSGAERRGHMKLLAADKTVQVELQRMTKFRNMVWMLASYHAYLNPLGEMESITIFALDITDRKDTDKRMGEAQKMEAIGELTGGLAHDFNNMLGIVLGNLEMMETELPQDDVVLVECFNAARQAATRGASVANSLLAVARRQNLDLALVDVNETLMSLIGLLRHSVGSNIRLGSQLCSGKLAAMADSSGLSNVVLNLVINARDALNEKAAGDRDIYITSDRLMVTEHNKQGLLPGSYALITVRDTGSGMTEEVRQRAFDPFFTTKVQGKGTGLGLATVRGFVEQLGGAVFIESVLGEGTTVSLYLPLLEPESREYQRREAERLAALQSLEILDTQPDAELDKLVARASQICNAKTALISLVDADRQWFKAKFGLAADQTPRRDAFCAHAIESSDEVFEVVDARDDSRFCGNPLVVGDPYIRFYAGVPLRDDAGHALGTLCVLDAEPRSLSGPQRVELRKLAQLAAQKIGATKTKALPAEVFEAKPDVAAGKFLTSETSPDHSIGEGRSVLVVDDEEGLCRIARKWLEAMGFAVQTSTSAEEALVLLREQTVDVLFSDIVMPGGLDGQALAKSARAISPELQVVLTTGFSPDAQDDLGGAKILRKPYTRADVQEVFASLRFKAMHADGAGI